VQANQHPAHVTSSGAGYAPRMVYELDHFINNFGHVQLRDHVAQLTVDKSGGFIYHVDTSGFQPNEVNVSVEGEQIVVTGEHKEECHGGEFDIVVDSFLAFMNFCQISGESIERDFTRRVAIPVGIQKDTIRSSVDEKGHLCIFGTPLATEKLSVHIEYKPAGPQQQNVNRRFQH
jgi:hypothetical protein